MFDLPTETLEDKREYRKFRKLLIKNGFVMMQESVYTKLLITPSQQATVCASIRRNKPASGLVQLMTVTEKQFQQIEYIVGESKSELLQTDERLVII